MNYYEKKAKKAYELYLSGKPFEKVYAVVEKDERFLVLKNGDKYSLAGGGIEEGEDVDCALKREILEEMNVNIEVIRSLGKINYNSKWNYEGKEFLVKYEAEIVYCKFISYGLNEKLGLEGEFEKDTEVEEISKELMLDKVAEFCKFGIKL